MKGKGKGINSRNKGVRGELEFAKLLRGLGLEARRGQQHKGTPDSPDVICEGLANIHFEVKRTEFVGRVPLFVSQAKNDASLTQVPVVVAKKNYNPWFAAMALSDFFRLIDAAYSLSLDREKIEDLD